MKMDGEHIVIAILVVCATVVLCFCSVNCERTAQACIKAGGNYMHGNCRFSPQQRSEQA